MGHTSKAGRVKRQSHQLPATHAFQQEDSGPAADAESPPRGRQVDKVDSSIEDPLGDWPDTADEEDRWINERRENNLESSSQVQD